MRLRRSARLWVLASRPASVPVQLAATEFFEGSVGFFQWKRFHFCFHRDARCEFEKFFAIAASQVRDRSDDAFVPKIDIGKGRDVAHVNSPANDNAAFCQRTQRGWHQ